MCKSLSQNLNPFEYGFQIDDVLILIELDNQW